MELNAEEVVAYWPTLKPLVAMADPPWRFEPVGSGVLSGTRLHHTYVEALWVIDEERAGVNRGAIPNRPGPVVVPVSFSGPLREAVEILQLPVRLETGG